jgi:hypothetical protein
MSTRVLCRPASIHGSVATPTRFGMSTSSACGAAAQKAHTAVLLPMLRALAERRCSRGKAAHRHDHTSSGMATGSGAMSVRCVMYGPRSLPGTCLEQCHE